MSRQTASSSSRRRGIRQGVTLLELMIALVITATLLVATAAALSSSFEAYAINNEQSMVLQGCRVALNRLVTTVRTSDVHSPMTPSKINEFAALGRTVTDTGISLIDERGNDITFRHDAATKRLLAVVNGRERVLARGVEVFSVTLEPAKSAASARTGGGWDLLRRASIQLTMEGDASTRAPGEKDRNQSVTLTAAVTPRRNSW